MYERPLRPDELLHYGVLGMKWGVRRYQPYAVVPRGKSKAPGIEIGEAKRITRQMDKADKRNASLITDALNSRSNISYRKDKLEKRLAKYSKKKSNWNKRRLDKATNKYENAKLEASRIVQRGKENSDNYINLGKKLLKNGYNIYTKNVSKTTLLNGERAAWMALAAIGEGTIEGGKVTKVNRYVNGVYTGSTYYLTSRVRKHKVRQSNTDPNKDKFVIK